MHELMALQQQIAYKKNQAMVGETVDVLIDMAKHKGVEAMKEGAQDFLTKPLDYTKLHAKTGIAHRRLKPTLGILDPENTRTMPPEVAAASGLDVLSHAIESYTAIPYSTRPRPERPLLRPAYQGANPISDVWSSRAIQMVARSIVRAVTDPEDDEAPGTTPYDVIVYGMGRYGGAVASMVMRECFSSGRSKRMSSSSVVRTVCRRRAPMFSMRSFT